MITMNVEITLLTKRQYRIQKDYPFDGCIGMSSCRHGRWYSSFTKIRVYRKVSNLNWFLTYVVNWTDLGTQLPSIFGMEIEGSFFHIHSTMDTLVDAYQTRVSVDHIGSSVASCSGCPAIGVGGSSCEAGGNGSLLMMCSQCTWKRAMCSSFRIATPFKMPFSVCDLMCYAG